MMMLSRSDLSNYNTRLMPVDIVTNERPIHIPAALLLSEMIITKKVKNKMHCYSIFVRFDDASFPYPYYYLSQ